MRCDVRKWICDAKLWLQGPKTQLGPLEKCSVVVDGPFGAAGTVMWLCAEHKKLVQQWNNKTITATVATDTAKKLAEQYTWPKCG